MKWGTVAQYIVKSILDCGDVNQVECVGIFTGAADVSTMPALWTPAARETADYRASIDMAVNMSTYPMTGVGPLPVPHLLNPIRTAPLIMSVGNAESMKKFAKLTELSSAADRTGHYNDELVPVITKLKGWDQLSLTPLTIGQVVGGLTDPDVHFLVGMRMGAIAQYVEYWMRSACDPANITNCVGVFTGHPDSPAPALPSFFTDEATTTEDARTSLSSPTNWTHIPMTGLDARTVSHLLSDDPSVPPAPLSIHNSASMEAKHS